ncbi:MAG: FHA domain-containing protein, partial [Deltaproteobacteria bacterium]|nr:FHA domain-containing protein [Deltaproteobacteria bacterium]
LGRQGRARAAQLRFDLLLGTGGVALGGELRAVAAELEACGLWDEAARAYVRAGDAESELRVLELAGNIERLEQRLRETTEAERGEHERLRVLQEVRDLDRLGERRRALHCAGEWLGRQAGARGEAGGRGADEDLVRAQLAEIRARLLRGPVVALEVGGERRRYALGAEITIGRAGANITVCSQAVSRQHLRLCRRDGQPICEDLQTRNGTTLRGALLAAPLPVGTGIELVLGGQVPCLLAPSDPAEPLGVLRVEVGGECYLAPLGPLRLGAWQICDAQEDEDRFVVVHAPAEREPLYLRGLRLGPEIELCTGDELCARRGGPVVLRVPAQG